MQSAITHPIDPAEFRFDNDPTPWSRPLMYMRLSMALAHLANPHRRRDQTERIQALVTHIMDYEPSAR